MTDNEFRAIVRAIHERLDAIEGKLDDLLGGGAGVREPAPPRPESPGDAIALDEESER